MTQDSARLFAHGLTWAHRGTLVLATALTGACSDDETVDPGAGSSAPVCTDEKHEDEVLAYVIPVGASYADHVEIGKLNVSTGDDGVEAKFYIDSTYKKLDEIYDFMWINVLTQAKDSAGPISSDPDFFSILPWIDPNPNDSSIGSDNEVFYWDINDRWDDDSDIHTEGSFSWFRDNPSQPPTVVETFQTYLVSVEEVNHNSICVLLGFEWTYTEDDDCTKFVGFLSGLSTTINSAVSNGQNNPSGPEKGGYPGVIVFSESQRDHIKMGISTPKGGDIFNVMLALPMDMLGSGLSGGFDHDDDGIAEEFVVGSRGADAGGLLNSGQASIAAAPSGARLMTWEGDLPQDAFGSAVALAGDTNGDGAIDVLVGAPQSNLSGDSTGSGYARLFSGASGQTLHTWTGETLGQQFGASVAGIGDVNADGFPDVIVGAPAMGLFGIGKAFVYSGFDGSTLHAMTGDVSDTFGFCVGSAGDVNADGVPDYFVTAPQLGSPRTGFVQLYSGASGQVIDVLEGDQLGEGFGFTCASLGNLVGDGRPELAVGSPLWSSDFEPSCGRVRVYSYSGHSHSPVSVAVAASTAGTLSSGPVTGPLPSPVGSGLLALPSFKRSLGWSIFGSTAYDCLGASACTIGDFDGDTYADVAIGAPQADLRDHVAGAGYVRVVTRNGAHITTVIGDLAYDMFGTTVAGIGDLDGDGRTEFLAGAPLADSPTFNSGTVQVVSDTKPTAWSDEGYGLAGTLGEPLLAGTGTLSPGSANLVKLSNATPSSPAMLFVALTSVPAPFKGGVLLAFPPIANLIALTSPTGTIPLALLTPASLPAGITLWLQWAIQDAGAVQGIALSNAIRGLTP